MIVFLFFQSWDAFFKSAAAGSPPGQAYVSPSSLTPSAVTSRAPSHGITQGAVDSKVIGDHLAVQAIIRSYQVGL